MEEKAQKRILERIREAETERDSRYGDLWRDCYRRYRSRPKENREGSNIFVPQTFMQCETIKGRIEESLFAERPCVAVLPREGTDELAAEKIQTLLDWQFNERMDLPRIIGETITGSMILYGTGVAYTGWQVKTRRMRRSLHGANILYDADGSPLLDEEGFPLSVPGEEVVEEDVILYDDPVVAGIPLTDFYCDPKADELDKARFCGHKEYVTRAMLEDLAEQGKYQIDWKHVEPYCDGEEEKDASNDTFGGGDQKGLYLVHHYWEDERHLVFLNREQCICEEENPFWHGQKPYDKCCYVKVPGEFYGIGVPELLAGLQDELNTSRNQRIDYNSLSLRRMWKLRKGCGLTARDLIWRQNGVLQVENMDDVAEINIQNLPADAFANEASIKQDMQDVTGCQDIILGLALANETATTTMTRDNNASLRFKAVVRAVIQDLLVPIAKKCISMDQQFLTNERVLRLLNQPIHTVFSVSPEEIDGNYDVYYCGTAIESSANRELNKEKALQAYSLALSDPAYQRDDAARMRLFRKVLSALGMVEGDELMPSCAPAPAALAEANAAADGDGELALLPLR